MAGLPSPETWHIPTRLKIYGNRGAAGISLTEFCEGLVCYWCHHSLEASEVLIFDGQVKCLDTKACDARHAELVKPHRPTRTVQAEKDETEKKAAKKDTPQTPEPTTNKQQKTTGAVGESPGRIFTCTTCNKRKRTASTRGRLPTVCKACKAKEQ